MLQVFDERNRDLVVNINGALVHRDQAGVSPFDASVQGGDAVWEGSAHSWVVCNRRREDGLSGSAHQTGTSMNVEMRFTKLATSIGLVI